MMIISIDPPKKRSLTPNEQLVYKLLQDGLTPFEIAKRIRMALRIDPLVNYHDVPPDSVMGLIASIREKGWEIPQNNQNNNEEENEMPKGQTTPPEKIAEIKALRSDGKTYQAIAAAANVSKTTVARVCQKEKEPAPTDADTSSKENNPITSITDNPGNVNTTEKIPEIVLEALTDTLEDLYGHKREITEVIENLEKRLETTKGYFGAVEKNIAALKKYIRSIGYGDVLTAIDSEQKCGQEADA